MTVNLGVARASRTRWEAWSPPLIGLLISVLIVVPIFLAAAVAAPAVLGPALGRESVLLAVLVAVAAGGGLLLMPALGVMGRVGAILLTATAGGMWLLQLLAGEPDSDSAPGLVVFAQVLLVGIPAGYFTLLFGALRAAGWSRRGPWMVVALGVALSGALFLIPSGPLTDIEMSERMVDHGLINVGVIVAILAAVIEWARRLMSRGHGDAATEDAGGSSPAR